MNEEQNMNVLQSFAFPNLEVSAAEDMYLRFNHESWPELATRGVRFRPGGMVSTDTFYNGLTVGAWKDRCDIESLVLRIEGDGRFMLTFGLHRYQQASVWLAEHALELSSGQQVDLPVHSWATLTDGMLFFRLRALDSGRLSSAAYVTPDAPRNDVRLGIVITHFNRQSQVLPAINRVQRELSARPDLAERMSLTVVDNSRNLDLQARPGIELLPNRNLGGTGGFARGLLRLKDSGVHTHALFMDDDASCETEAIARCFALLQYAVDPKLSVAGALLRESAPWQLFEKGARFDGEVHPMCSGMNMQQVPELLKAERNLGRPDYGAWWFFAFPLSAARRFPFPFFVRGDDVLFGLANRFHIVTLNGIACYGEDFAAKHSPLTAYLDARYHLVCALLRRRRGLSRIFWVGTRLFIKQLTSYHYTSARAVTLAVQHVTEGPSFFVHNMDMASVRKEIGSWVPEEKLRPLDTSAIDLGATRGARAGKESKLRRLGRLLTLQGFLLPGFLIKNRTTVQEKAFHGRAAAVFRYRRVLYLHPHSGSGYMAEYDRPRFFGELGRFIAGFFRLLSRMPTLCELYARDVEYFSTERFWRDVYGWPKAMPATMLSRGMPPVATEASPFPLPSSSAVVSPTLAESVAPQASAVHDNHRVSASQPS